MLMKAGLLIKLAMSKPSPAAICGQTETPSVAHAVLKLEYEPADSLGWLPLYASALRSSGWTCRCRSQGLTPGLS